ncbi:GNAT family N-acetyltransferase [Polaribacter batillariae]|uniref:GNAT family N-acetyltransferase n=1 Tax=Polaribacter batillariae TaxID=2808900 RepID=A0ABX7SXY0_9FLAO|nr:GNAT family N-acetyltransferase [Polaribacter batillariae]QTD38130.1 GNAT family N-acetyltransferase [Polaribacter batillariae]
MIFETERLIVRKLIIDDLEGFHELESNSNVLKYATGEVKNFLDNKKELNDLLKKYDKKNNNFWIYAVENKLRKEFVGTVALVKDGADDEIGYRFLEKYWNNGFGLEICKGLISYCKKLKKPKIIGYVVDNNIASAKILKKCNFIVVDEFVNDNNLKETKYQLIL